MTSNVKQRARERAITRAMDRCQHFTGVQDDRCAAGVAYNDVRDTSTQPFGFPCIATHAQQSTCAMRVWVTRAQAEAEQDESEAAWARVNTCLAAIRAAHGTARGVRAAMPCPTGCGGTLRYSIAGVNGHVHGVCSTEGCASWMQ